MTQAPMNFLHLTTFYPPYSFGGDAMYIYRLAHALGDEGHHVDIVHDVDAYYLQHPAEPEIHLPEHPNVHRHELRSTFGALSPFLTHQTGQPILKMDVISRLMKQRSYMVIHFHNISLLGPGILAIEQPESRIFPDRRPVKLYTTHEHWLICPNHVLWKYNQRACEKAECLPCVLRAKRPPQLWRYTGMLKKLGRHVDRYLSPSQFTARMHAERGFPYPVDHLPYFIPPADEDWRDPKPSPFPFPYCLFVGRLETIKGVHHLVDQWNDISGCDLVIVGSGTQEQVLKARSKDNPHIHFTGSLPQNELGRYYYHAVATLVPSLTYETFGVIIVESFARKTPVIVRDLGALPEIIKESKGGYIFKTDSELFEAVNNLRRNPGERQELGERGYQAFRRKWSREAHMPQYYAIIEEIRSQRPGQ
jgi:glycosyltransferase involved in cell wall biosynthesis